MSLRSSMAIKVAAATAIMALFGWTGHARAANLEPAGINLGGTSFFDGFGPTKQGWAYLGYYQYASATHIENNKGNDVPIFNHPKINDILILNQLAYTTNKRVLGGHLGFTVLVPTVAFQTHFDTPGVQLTDNGTGMGDITFGSYIQFDPVIRGGRPVFSQRIEFDAIAPVGKYSSSIDINQGSNFWSLNPYWAATWLPTPKTEVSWRLHYLYNFANTKPAGVPPTVVKGKAGTATWVNFTASYAVTPHVHLGINGYYFKQLTSDKWTLSNGSTTNGAAFGDTGKAELFAIGPGAFWEPSHTNLWFFNVYFQTQAKNRARGTVFNVHWVHNF